MWSVRLLPQPTSLLTRSAFFRCQQKCKCSHVFGEFRRIYRFCRREIFLLRHISARMFFLKGFFHIVSRRVAAASLAACLKMLQHRSRKLPGAILDPCSCDQLHPYLRHMHPLPSAGLGLHPPKEAQRWDLLPPPLLTYR